MTCHMHPGNEHGHHLPRLHLVGQRNGRRARVPEGHSAIPTPRADDDPATAIPKRRRSRGLWCDPKFLRRRQRAQPAAREHAVRRLPRPRLGFRARLQARPQGQPARRGRQDDRAYDDPEHFKKAVHLKDIHLEKGMHCVDCHFKQDIHGNGKLYGEPRAAVEIDCIDCHGTVDARATLITSGRPRAGDGTSRSRCARRSARRASQRRRRRSSSASMVEDEVGSQQVVDTITPGDPHYNEKSRLAKTMQKDGTTWGDAASPTKLAHAEQPDDLLRLPLVVDDELLRLPPLDEGQPEEADAPQRGRETPGTRRLQLPDAARRHLHAGQGRHGHRATASPAARRARSVSSQNQHREWMILPGSRRCRRPASAATRSPPTCRTRCARKETKRCTDCHVSPRRRQQRLDGAAAHAGHELRELHRPLRLGGRGQRGFEAVAVTERDEPQAVIGSHLHELAYPADFDAHDGARPAR